MGKDNTAKPRPICFMIMPFGTKETGIANGSAPTKVNFDYLWENVFSPILKELGYDPVRADCDIDALIIKDMMERLTIADLIVADLSLNNGNVYYEIGIRHAAKEVGCALISAEWAKPLFDVQQMRRINYPLSTETITEVEAITVRDLLKKHIPEHAGGRSPVHDSVIGYPKDVKAETASSFRDFVARLTHFQNEVNAVKIMPEEAKAEQIDKIVSEYTSTDMPVLFSVAYEVLLLIRDHIGWERVVDFIDSLPESLRYVPVVQEQYCLALGKLDKPFKAIAALENLVKYAGNSSERQGLIGGRYKKLYRSAQESNEQQRYLNKAIEHYTQGFYLDLNDYYCSCNLPRLLRERNNPGDGEEAQRIAVQVLLSCERAERFNSTDEWFYPTLLGAAFDAADLPKALKLSERIKSEGIQKWKLETTIADLDHSISQQPDGQEKGRLLQIVADLKEFLAKNKG